MSFDPFSCSEEATKWPKSATLQLLSLIKAQYRRLLNDVGKIAAYSDMAKRINAKHETNFTYAEIESKWKGLRRAYIKINDQGRSKKCWEYYDLVHEIMCLAQDSLEQDKDTSNLDNEVEDTLSADIEALLSDTELPCDDDQEFLPEEVSSLPETEIEVCSEGLKWSKRATLLLISLIKSNYKRLQSGIKKKVYMDIAKQINAKEKTHFTYEQVDSKWKGLKRIYHKFSEHNNDSTSNKSKMSWDYYDLINEILSSATVVTSAKEDVKYMIKMPNDEDCITYSLEEIDSDIKISLEPKIQTIKNSRKRRHIEMSDEKEIEKEAAQERRHNERMALSKKFLNVFQQMVDKM